MPTTPSGKSDNADSMGFRNLRPGNPPRKGSAASDQARANQLRRSLTVELLIRKNCPIVFSVDARMATGRSASETAS